MTRLAPEATRARATDAYTWWREASGSVADLGVLIPIAVTLIVANGLSPTATLLPAAVGYLAVALVYRLPVAVQPLKAFGAAAIAIGAGPDVIAAGALVMGATFLVLGASGLIDRVARLFPVPVIRGVQLAVGLTFVKIAWGLVDHPPAAFEHQPSAFWVGVLAVGLAAALLVWRRHLILLVVLAAIGYATVVAAGDGLPGLGPAPLTIPDISAAEWMTAATLLVLPQLPLTFANSCLAPADAARRYFGADGERVTPGRLAQSLGALNLLAGATSGMPVCHGAGGLSAHVSFGARTWRAPVVIGGALLTLAVGAGTALAAVLVVFPLGVLAAMLVVAGVVHAMLLRDLRGAPDWSVALAVGVIGVATNLAWAVLIGLALAATLQWLGRARVPRRSAH